MVEIAFEIEGKYTPHKHADIAHYKSKLSSRFSEYRLMVSHRNPLSRALSMYFSPHRYSMGLNKYGPDHFNIDEFEEVIRSMDTMCEFISIKGAPRKPDYQIRFQYLMSDFRRTCAMAGLPEPDGQAKLNTSVTTLNFRRALARRRDVRAIVTSVFLDDYKYFGYPMPRI